MATIMLLVLSSCAALERALPGPSPDDGDKEVEVVGWSVLHAAAEQWQVAFSLMQVGPPWALAISLVEQLRPGASPPRYQGELPINTIFAPALPTDVGRGGEYGWRRAPDLGIEELHNGADIAAAQHSNVMASMEGVVRAVFWDVWGGNRVEVAHTGDMVTTYNHLEKVLVEQGDRLEASQQLGTVGQTGSRVTGPHLHFETWVDGEAVDPQSFDWIEGDRIIPAPRDHARNPPVIERRGHGDRSILKPGQESCPHTEDDPISCKAPDPPPRAESCETLWTPDCRSPGRPPALELCQDLLYGRYNCLPLEVYPGPEDCPAAAEVGARTDCPPVEWPDWADSALCQDLLYGRYNCLPLEVYPGPEDCPAAAEVGARTDCPPVEWPDWADSALCQDLLYGRYNCLPLEVYPGPEDCPAAAEVGARTDCPPAATELPSPSENFSSPPAGGEITPSPATEATPWEGQLERDSVEDPSDQHLDPQGSPR